MAGCVHNKSVKTSTLANRNLSVIPVRGQPVVVSSENLALVAAGALVGGVGGGVAANAADQGASSDKRATLTGRLNADAPDFKPEVVLAEECVKLLKSSPKAAFASVTMRAEPVDLPGRSEMVRGETQPFKSDNSHSWDWFKLGTKWREGPPIHDNAPASGADHPTVALEVTYQVVFLKNGKSLESQATIRVADLSKGEILGSHYTITLCNIRPITQTSDVSLFVEDFRKCAHELAQKCLRDLNLL